MKHVEDLLPHDLEKSSKIALRACLLRALSYGFSYPITMQFAGFVKCLAICNQSLNAFSEGESRSLRAVFKAVRPLARSDYEAEYLRVFTHVFAADCNPCETAYVAKHIFQASQRLATITGFYKAFGLESGGERPDHMAVELEFLAFLRYRESMEVPATRQEDAELLRRGQRVFIEQHIGRWAPVFAELVRRKAEQGPIVALADLLSETMLSEAMSYGIELPELPEDLSLINVLAEADIARMPIPSGQGTGGVFSV